MIIATPMAALREQLRACRANWRVRWLWLCKGFESRSTGSRGRPRPRDPASVAPRLAAGVLAVRASRSKWRAASRPRSSRPARMRYLRDALVAAFHGAALRIYTTDDRSASKSAARSRTCSRSPPASPTALRSASTRAPR